MVGFLAPDEAQPRWRADSRSLVGEALHARFSRLRSGRGAAWFFLRLPVGELAYRTREFLERRGPVVDRFNKSGPLAGAIDLP